MYGLGNDNEVIYEVRGKLKYEDEVMYGLENDNEVIYELRGKLKYEDETRSLRFRGKRQRVQEMK
jgi:hypothetical protein